MNEDVKNEEIVEETKHNFFTEFMSINEAKVSCLLLVLIVSIAFGAYMYYTVGEISKVWSDVINTILYCVTGINVSDKLAGQGGLLGNLFNSNKPVARDNHMEKPKQ